MDTARIEVMLILRQHDIQKSTWRTHSYLVDFESRINLKISASNQCHNFHMDLPVKIDEISTNFPREILTSNRW